MLVDLTVKGGDRVTRTVKAAAVRDALLAYLKAAGRLESMQPDSPLWLAHDRTGANEGHALTSHGFAKRFKHYARLAGVGAVHLHQTRHSVARIMGDETQSAQVVQEILGHRNLSTTRIYLARVGIQRDQSSERMADRLGL
jgi:site-specific recombinase XerD